MRATFWCAVTALVFAADVAAADFGSRGGPEPANVDEIANFLRQDPYDLELLISYGTSKGGSAGHSRWPSGSDARAMTWSTAPTFTPTARLNMRRTFTPTT